MKEYRDHYFRKAKQENYPARSVYKLKEIDERFKLLRAGLKILDLGAAPGSWSLGAAEKIGATGHILACDLKSVDTALPEQVTFIQDDLLNPSPEFMKALKKYAPFQLVMSDMAPSTTGATFTDQCRSFELAMAALEIARAYLAEKGNFVVKIFMGPDVNGLLFEMKKLFGHAKIFKPKSSRAESKETFCIGLQKKI